MNGDLDDLKIHMLALILRAQFEILAKLNETPTLVARPPLPIYTPPKKVDKNG